MGGISVHAICIENLFCIYGIVANFIFTTEEVTEQE